MKKKKRSLWPVAGVGVALLVLASSWLSRGTSMAYVKNYREAIRTAVGAGDYGAAQALYEHCQVTRCNGTLDNVLGAESELEELVYPERVVEREIARYEGLNTTYPGHRDILVTLASLYGQIEQVEKQEYFLEEVRKLDPNNVIFRP